MTVKKHEDKYIHINKEALQFALFFGLLGIGLIIVSILSGIETYNHSRNEANDYCWTQLSEGKDYVESKLLADCLRNYLPVAPIMSSVILFLIGLLSIFAGLGGYN